MASLLSYVKTSPISPYLYDGNLLLAETDNADKIQKVYINDGQGIIGMVRYIYKDGGTFSHYQPLSYMFDSLGSVSLVTGEDGKPLQNYKYTPYGASTNVESDPVNGLRFVGRYGGYQDDDTNLTYFWHRWYDSKDGRWTSRDPIGIRGGLNLMAYVKNKVNNKIDITGFCCENCLGKYTECMKHATNTRNLIIGASIGASAGCSAMCLIVNAEDPPLAELCAAGCIETGSEVIALAGEHYFIEIGLCEHEHSQCNERNKCCKK
jgi:RHS repeat-associated protein